MHRFQLVVILWAFAGAMVGGCAGFRAPVDSSALDHLQTARPLEFFGGSDYAMAAALALAAGERLTQEEPVRSQSFNASHAPYLAFTEWKTKGGLITIQRVSILPGPVRVIYDSTALRDADTRDTARLDALLVALHLENAPGLIIQPPHSSNARLTGSIHQVWQGMVVHNSQGSFGDGALVLSNLWDLPDSEPQAQIDAEAAGLAHWNRQLVDDARPSQGGKAAAASVWHIVEHRVGYVVTVSYAPADASCQDLAPYVHWVWIDAFTLEARPWDDGIGCVGG